MLQCDTVPAQLLDSAGPVLFEYSLLYYSGELRRTGVWPGPTKTLVRNTQKEHEEALVDGDLAYAF